MHWGTILRNVFSNWVSYLVTAAVGFLLAPFVLHQLGNTGYGLWTLVISLTGYFGLLDLGIRSSVGRFVARYIALKDTENVNRTVSTAFAILAGGGAIAMLATIVVVRFFFDSFQVEPQFQSSGKLALLITGLNMAAVLPLGVFSSVLIALERNDVLSGVTVVGELARAALVVACLKNGYGLVSLAVISLLITVTQYSAMAVFAKSLYRPLQIRLKCIGRSTFGPLLHFGVHRFITIVANQLIFYSNSIVIATFLGAGAITYFAIAASIINYGRNVVSMVTDTLAPSAIRMDAREDLAGLHRLLITGTMIALMIAMPICLGFIFLGKQFITLWVGKEYASSALFLIILAIPQFTSMSQYAAVVILSGMAKHHALAYIALAEGIVNLTLSIVLIRKFGLVGVALATMVPHLISTGIIVPFYTLRTMKLPVGEYLRKAFLRPALCALPIVALGYWFSRVDDGSSWILFAAQALAMCGVFGVMGFFFCLDLKQRSAAVEHLSNIFHREPAIHEA